MENPKVTVPDALPPELWREIAVHIAGAPKSGGDSHLKSWLSVAPASLARHMHDAAFAILFRDVKIIIGYNEAVKASTYLSRILERSEACIQAARRIDVWPRVDIYSYAEEIKDQIVHAFATALPRFPMLQEFFWHEQSVLPMPLRILRTLLSVNKQLRILDIGPIHPDPPRIDLAGLTQLAELSIHYEEDIEIGSTHILFPKNLQTLHLTHARVDDISTFETLANNALSLGTVELTQVNVGSNFWSRRTPYTALHTISLAFITLPLDPGFDFTAISALDSLSLRFVNEVRQIGSLPIGIRAPDTLRHFRLGTVRTIRPETSLLLGVNILGLESLDVTDINLTPEDINSILLPDQHDAHRAADTQSPPRQSLPLPYNLTKLRLGEMQMSILATVLKSTCSFPVLRDLEFRIDRDDFADFFESLGSFLGRCPALENLVFEPTSESVHKVFDERMDFFLLVSPLFEDEPSSSSLFLARVLAYYRSPHLERTRRCAVACSRNIAAVCSLDSRRDLAVFFHGRPFSPSIQIQ
ncbi:hypothetical protein MVEN_00954800 [Mycena venus]|uniref:Uncharacterized protein n=1 Tax=Mycena venus TaxID=2733690 RepID=A0A8H6YC17_9AGAR|nr:hypothetical protein MVEN_00954800 [Mycena venus]